MPITREDLTTYAQTTMQDLAIEAGIELSETGIRYELDQAIAALGEDTANTGAAYALIEYYILRRCRLNVAARVDVSISGSRQPRSQIYQHISDLLVEAGARAASAGHPIASAAQLSIAALNLDYLEPEITQWQ